MLQLEASRATRPWLGLALFEALAAHTVDRHQVTHLNEARPLLKLSRPLHRSATRDRPRLSVQTMSTLLAGITTTLVRQVTHRQDPRSSHLTAVQVHLHFLLSTTRPTRLDLA